MFTPMYDRSFNFLTHFHILEIKHGFSPPASTPLLKLADFNLHVAVKDGGWSALRQDPQSRCEPPRTILVLVVRKKVIVLKNFTAAEYVKCT